MDTSGSCRLLAAALLYRLPLQDRAPTETGRTDDSSDRLVALPHRGPLRMKLLVVEDEVKLADGLGLLAALRQSKQTPVLMLTARVRVEDRVAWSAERSRRSV
jgi:hypothetical protein